MHKHSGAMARLLFAASLALLPTFARADPVTIATLAAYAVAAAGYTTVAAWALFAIPAVGKTHSKRRSTDKDASAESAPVDQVGVKA